MTNQMKIIVHIARTRMFLAVCNRYVHQLMTQLRGPLSSPRLRVNLDTNNHLEGVF